MPITRHGPGEAKAPQLVWDVLRELAYIRVQRSRLEAEPLDEGIRFASSSRRLTHADYEALSERLRTEPWDSHAGVAELRQVSAAPPEDPQDEVLKQLSEVPCFGPRGGRRAGRVAQGPVHGAERLRWAVPSPLASRREPRHPSSSMPQEPDERCLPLLEEGLDAPAPLAHDQGSTGGPGSQLVAPPLCHCSRVPVMHCAGIPRPRRPACPRSGIFRDGLLGTRRAW